MATNNYGGPPPVVIPFDESTLSTESTKGEETTSKSVLGKLFVDHTKKTCCIALVIPIICVGVIVVSGALSIFGVSGRDYSVLSDIRTKRADGRTAALDKYPYLPAGTTVSSLEQRKTDGGKNINILLRGIHSDGKTIASLNNFQNASNVLSKKLFALHKRAEDLYYGHLNFSRFCRKDETGLLDCNGNPRDCALPSSYLNHPSLYGINDDQIKGDEIICGRRNGSDEISDQSFETFLNDMFGNDTFNVKNFFDTNITTDDRTAWAAKSIIQIGTPFPGYSSTSDRPSEQSDLYMYWAESITKKINEELSTPSVDIYALSGAISNASFLSLVTRDLNLAAIAIVLVIIVIWINSSSFLLTSSAIAQVLLAFPFAFIFYNFVFRQLYFSALQILTIFLILGIGADNVLVFTDAWKQAAVVLGPDVDLVSRMSWTYRRAVLGMMATSFTTAAAFFVTATSTIMPISTLGVWAGTVVVLQFVLVITVYPCAVIMWHRFWRPRMFVSGFKKINDNELDKDLAIPIWYCLLPVSWRPEVKVPEPGEYRSVERFFRGPWLKFVKSGRFVLIGIAVVLASLSLWRALTLDTPSELESFLPKNDPFVVPAETISDAFPRGNADFQLKVWVTWGVSGVDRSGLGRYDVNETGTVVLDNTFNLALATVQQRLFDACVFFGSNTELIFQDDTGIDAVDCWINDYSTWRKGQGNIDFVDFDSQLELVNELLEFGKFKTEDGSQPFLKYLRSQRIGFDRQQ